MSEEIKDLEQKLESGEISLGDIPAGYKKKEVISRKKAVHEQKIDEAPETTMKIPDKFKKPEREIQHKLRANFMDIRVPGCVVRWVQFTTHRGYKVWRAKTKGWIVVTGDMVLPEDQDLKSEDNTFKVGDVMAMCMPEELYYQQLAEKSMKATAELRGESLEELRYLSKKTKGAFQVISDQNDIDQLRKPAARKMALKHIGERMKTGIIPGIPIK